MKLFTALVVFTTVLYEVNAEKKVICYYGSWATYRNSNGQCNVNDLDPFICTHLVYSFVGLGYDLTSIRVLDEWLELPSGRGNFALFNSLKEKNPHLKTILAIGGWNEGSRRYSLMANDPTVRASFVQNAVSFLRLHGFDGLDFDWEYPNKRDSVHGEKDIEAFSQLLKELKAELSKYGLLLTAAVSATESASLTSYDIPEISKHLDFINLMTYDLHGSWDPFTGHNAGLYRSQSDTELKGYNVNASVDFWISQGAPPEKLVLGIPLYGRTFRLENPSLEQVGAPSSGPGIAGQYTFENGIIGYNELCEKKLTDKTWSIKWDSSALVPYAVSGNDWISYDNADSVRLKTEFAVSLNLGGVMVWSIETDDFRGICHSRKFELLNSINDALGRDVVTQSPDDVDETDEDNEVISQSAESVEQPGSSTVAPTGLCKSSGFVGDPNDCRLFYMCALVQNKWVAYKYTCPANLYWDKNKSICNYQSEVDCQNH